MIQPIIWDGKNLKLLDQRKLPFEKEYVKCSTLNDVCFAIKEMVVRGAPAIGVAAGFGFYFGVVENIKLEDIENRLLHTRPTAVNLKWAVEKMKKCYLLKKELLQEALNLMEEDIKINRQIGKNGAKIINDGDNILTHCNAGSLATAGYGTALGVIRAAKEEGKNIHVYVDETRPYLQGARLTTFELNEENIDNTLICDNMAGFLMWQKKIDKVIVGADRIALNGDVANKIGTYQLAVLASYHNIPFYVAAPLSTFDKMCKSGEFIPIEERDDKEIKEVFGKKITVESQKCYNPAFDITPNSLITGIVTEIGLIKPFEIINYLK